MNIGFVSSHYLYFIVVGVLIAVGTLFGFVLDSRTRRISVSVGVVYILFAIIGSTMIVTGIVSGGGQ